MAETPFTFVSPGVSADDQILVLAPGTPDGWFDGRMLLAHGTSTGLERSTSGAAAARLEATFHSTGDELTAALLTYEGEAFVMHYDTCHAIENTPGAQRIEGALLAETSHDFSAVTYEGAVEATRDRIARGDVYVLNLTTRIAGTPVATPWDSFVELHARAQGTMSAFFGSLDAHTPTIASASPERFLRLRLRGGETHIDVRPIKGTRPRDPLGEVDAALRTALAADPKEQAEHVMIVDLIRNDIGRVAVPGTVRVDPLMLTETTPYCHQLVSGVHGIVKPDATFAQILASLFPCGSITGAPKRAAMRFIDDLESSPRGAYCGALVVALAGQIDSSVLIRTMEWRSAGRVVWGTGCGITYDSDPVDEWREVLLKSIPVLGTLDRGGRGFTHEQRRHGQVGSF